MSPCSSTQRSGSVPAAADAPRSVTAFASSPLITPGSSDMRRFKRRPSNCEGENCRKDACVLECGSALPLFHAGMNPHRKVRDREDVLADTRDAYAPQNSLRRCKEVRGTTTNDRNETNHFADCCLSIVVTLCSEAGAAREKSAHARRCKENRCRGGGRSKKAW